MRHVPSRGGPWSPNFGVKLQSRDFGLRSMSGYPYWTQFLMYITITDQDSLFRRKILIFFSNFKSIRCKKNRLRRLFRLLLNDSNSLWFVISSSNYIINITVINCTIKWKSLTNRKFCIQLWDSLQFSEFARSDSFQRISLTTRWGKVTNLYFVVVKSSSSSNCM